MSNYVPEQGDIVMIDFDPSVGHEIQKRRPAIVMSHAVMAKHSGMILVCPITSTVRGTDLEVSINGRTTSGVAISIQLRSMDYRRRKAEFVEKADWDVVVKLSEKLQKLIAV